MNSFADALKKANIEFKEDNFKPFETVEDVVLPCMVEGNLSITVSQTEIKDANYIRRSKTPLNIKELNELKMIKPNRKLLQWLIDNEDKCFEVNEGSVRRREGKFVNQDDFDSLWEEDTKYGFSCLAYYLRYSSYSRDMKLVFNYTAMYMENYAKAAGQDKSCLRDIMSSSLLNQVNADAQDEDEIISSLNELVKVSEFIPVFIDRSNTVYFNSWEKNPIFKPMRVESLGANIMDSEKAMTCLEGWLANGGKIKHDVWYYLNESENGEWYLKRDLYRSPKVTK